MRRCVLFATGIVLAATSVCAQSASQACADSTLPDGVRSELTSEYGNWRVETFADLDAGYQKAWIAKRPNDCPGIVAGHFEGKGELSYALLLIPRTKGVPGFRLIVFSKASGKGDYSANVIEQSDKGGGGNSGIFHVDPGVQFDEQKFSTFKLKSEGIYLEYFEASGFIYYWKHGRFVTVVESD